MAFDLFSLLNGYSTPLKHVASSSELVSVVVQDRGDGRIMAADRK
jgi:hypothetical protein